MAACSVISTTAAVVAVELVGVGDEATCSRNSSTVSNSRGRADELGQVLEPALGLDRVLGLELGDVARLRSSSASSSGAGPVVDASSRSVVEQLEERRDALHRRGR